MSWSQDRATAQNFPEFAQNLENCMRKQKNAFLPLYLFFFFVMIHTYYVILGMIFTLTLAQNFGTKVLTPLKIQLLECLQGLPCLVFRLFLLKMRYLSLKKI